MRAALALFEQDMIFNLRARSTASWPAWFSAAFSLFLSPPERIVRVSQSTRRRGVVMRSRARRRPSRDRDSDKRGEQVRARRITSHSSGRPGGSRIVSQKKKLTTPLVAQVKVMLRVSGDPGASAVLGVDKKRKQLTLQEPGHAPAPDGRDDRRIGVAAPKMFAFDGLFTQQDSQVRPRALNEPATIDVIALSLLGRRGRLGARRHCHRRGERLGRMRFLLRSRSSR